MRTLETIGQEAHEINIINGWDVFTADDWKHSGDPHVLKIMTHMALVHSEVSEATEAVRNRDLENFREELADAVIRLASIAYGMEIDLEAEVVAKLVKNREREFRHGDKSI